MTALALFVVIAHATTTTLVGFWQLLGIALCFTSLAPLGYVLWLYATGRISDLDMSIRAERERVSALSRAREIAKVGFDNGALSYLDLLDAERTLAETRAAARLCAHARL